MSSKESYFYTFAFKLFDLSNDLILLEVQPTL
jgi:hypothetical protein